MKKIIKRVILGLSLVVVIGLVIVYFTLNTIVASEIESAATDALGVETTVSSVNIGLFEGRSTVSELQIKNPKGYQGNFLTLDEGILGLSIGSVFSKRIEVKEITLDSIHLNLIERVGGSNLGTILDHSDDGSSEDESSSSDSSSDGGDDQKFIIDLVSVKDIEITIAIEPVTSEHQPTKLTIDEIVVRDIGRKENGVTLDQVMSILVKSIVGSAAKAAPGQIPSLLLTTMEGGLSSLSHLDLGGVKIDLGTGLADGLGNVDKAPHSGGKSVDETIKDVGKGIESLLGDSKEQSNDASKKKDSD
ncbi:MAG: hypothetical protein CMJ67_06465 [Planctomycetaceae bacterium]|nr:hypothetical protein [Planctomycetaceae bacterium]